MKLRRMLKRLTRRRTVPKRGQGEAFGVVEGGTGKLPVGLVKAAARSHKAGKKREFIGADTKKVNVAKLLTKIGLRELPPNIRFVQGGVAEVLEALPRGSQSVVFASYLDNNLSTPDSVRLVSAAMRALRPNGRLVLIQDKGNVMGYQEYANHLGLELGVLPLQERVLRKSKEKALSSRSNAGKRKNLFRTYSQNAKRRADIKSLMGLGFLKSPAEFVYPTAYVFRRKLGKKAKRRPIVEIAPGIFPSELKSGDMPHWLREAFNEKLDNIMSE